MSAISQLPIYAAVAMWLAGVVGADAQMPKGDTTIHLGLDTAADLIQPEQIPHIAGHDDLTLILHENGTISERHTWGAGSIKRDVNSSGKLGGSVTPISSWHVKSSNVLERRQSFPQNTRTWRVTIAGSSCKLDVIDTLRPGFTTHTFTRASNGKIGYFANYRVTGTACSIQ